MIDGDKRGGLVCSCPGAVKAGQRGSAKVVWGKVAGYKLGWASTDIGQLACFQIEILLVKGQP